jgi:hypothetical protein
MGADGAIADDDEIALGDDRLDCVPHVGKAGQESAEDRPRPGAASSRTGSC